MALTVMRLLYITVNTAEEARNITQALLSGGLAVCCNWFPITCAYRWEGKLIEEPETVLIVKTREGYRDRVERVVRDFVSYTQAIIEIEPTSVNERFREWLEAEVSALPPSR